MDKDMFHEQDEIVDHKKAWFDDENLFDKILKIMVEDTAKIIIIWGILHLINGVADELIIR